jgi:hypothetical protein
VEEACRALMEAEAARSERKQTLQQLLHAEDLPVCYMSDAKHGGLPAVLAYIATGAGGEQAALDAVRDAARPGQLQEERRQLLSQHLAAAQLLPPSCWRQCKDAADFVVHGKGSVAAAVEAVRAQHEALRAQQGRERDMLASLASEGLPEAQLADLVAAVPAVPRHIISGKPAREAALEAARPWIARERRGLELEAALEEADLCRCCANNPTACDYVESGDGSLEAAVVACLQNHLECEAAWNEMVFRQLHMARLLAPHGIDVGDYSCWVPELDAYLQDGIGEEEAVVVAVLAEKNRQEAGWVPDAAVL